VGIIALLAGSSLFGIYQSLVLFRQNMVLTGRVDRLQIELSATQLSLNRTKTSLSASYQKNAELENRTVFLKTRLDRAKSELGEQKQKIGFLLARLHESRTANEYLQTHNAQTSEDYVRLSFENQEMKKTLSSIVELKKAIAALRKKPRRRAPKEETVRKPKPAAASKPRVQMTVPAPVADSDLDGNVGYVIKDGQSTLSDLVDIRVVPVPENTQGI
jgi:septal ring factor EnvC (AmiA/AmiB activator)